MNLLQKLKTSFQDFAYRHGYAESFFDAYLASQIQALREQRKLTQAALAQLAGMRQSQVSRLENANYSRWQIRTLKKLARAFDVMLVVKFENFGQIVKDAETFNRAALERPAFAEDPVFSSLGPVTTGVELIAAGAKRADGICINASERGRFSLTNIQQHAA